LLADGDEPDAATVEAALAAGEELPRPASQTSISAEKQQYDPRRSSTTSVRGGSHMQMIAGGTGGVEEVEDGNVHIGAEEVASLPRQRRPVLHSPAPGPLLQAAGFEDRSSFKRHAGKKGEHRRSSEEHPAAA